MFLYFFLLLPLKYYIVLKKYNYNYSLQITQDKYPLLNVNRIIQFQVYNIQIRSFSKS